MNGNLSKLYPSIWTDFRSLKAVLPLAFLAALLCATFNVDLSRRYSMEIAVTATGQKLSPDATAAVVWIKSPTVAALERNFEIKKSKGWEIKDNLIFVSTYYHPAELEVRGKSTGGKIEFYKTPHSGEVLLEINGIRTTLDLFDSQQSTHVIDLRKYFPARGSLVTPLLEYIGRLATFFLLFVVVIAGLRPIYARLPAPHVGHSVALSAQTDQRDIGRAKQFLVLLTVVILGLFLFVFYPGIMMYDSYLMYMQAISHQFQDWHSPMMAVPWSLIDKIISGSGGMFLLHSFMALYSFYLLSRVALLKRKKLFFLPIITLFLPMISIQLFVLMTDISMVLSFLLAFSFWYFWRTTGKLNKPRLMLIFGILFYASAVRHTALAAAIPLMILFLLDCTTPRKALLASLAIAALFFLTSNLFIYQILKTANQRVSQAIMAHDLMGIYEITNQNYFPENYLNKEDLDKLMIDFDHKNLDPTTFIEYERMFISFDYRILQNLKENWITAILEKPFAYLTHRWILFKSFLVDLDGWTPTTNVSEAIPPVLQEMSPPLMKETYLGKIHSAYIDWLYNNCGILFRAITYVFASVVIILLFIRRGLKSAIALAASSLLYIAPYFFLAPAGCYRYTYWSVFTTVLALLVIWMETDAGVREDPARNP